MTHRQQLIALLEGIAGFEARPSPVAGGIALFFHGKEFAHFHDDQELDLRLTRRTIEAQGLRHPPHSRVHPTRSATSPWIELRLTSEDEVRQVAALVRLAMVQMGAKDLSA